MVTIDTNCHTCVHFTVCSLTDDVCETKNKVMKEFEDVGPIIEINVRCKEYRKETTVRTPRAITPSSACG